jgi:hypothetical protein
MIWGTRVGRSAHHAAALTGRGRRPATGAVGTSAPASFSAPQGPSGCGRGPPGSAFIPGHTGSLARDLPETALRTSMACKGSEVHGLLSIHPSNSGALCPMRARGPDKNRRQAAKLHVSRATRRRAPGPSQAVAPVRIRSGLPTTTSTTRPLTWTNDGRRPSCLRPRVRTVVTAGRLVPVAEGPSPVFGVADRFVRRWAELEPTQGLIYGRWVRRGGCRTGARRVGPGLPTPSATGWPS